MRLILDREDLKPEHKNVNCSQTKFEHFTPQVQQAITEAGKAQFREYDGSNYNAIYPPTEAQHVCDFSDGLYCKCGKSLF